jgi:hypothetical protein
MYNAKSNVAEFVTLAQLNKMDGMAWRKTASKTNTTHTCGSVMCLGHRFTSATWSAAVRGRHSYCVLPREMVHVCHDCVVARFHSRSLTVRIISWNFTSANSFGMADVYDLPFHCTSGIQRYSHRGLAHTIRKLSCIHIITTMVPTAFVLGNASSMDEAISVTSSLIVDGST